MTEDVDRRGLDPRLIGTGSCERPPRGDLRLLGTGERPRANLAPILTWRQVVTFSVLLGAAAALLAALVLHDVSLGIGVGAAAFGYYLRDLSRSRYG
jgi:hypothetical protein